MTLKEQIAWWSAAVASLLGGVVGLYAGYMLFIRVMGLDPTAPADPTLAMLGLLPSMLLGSIVGYVVAFSLWIAFARTIFSPSELLAVASNCHFQSPSNARLNRRWVTWLLRIYHLHDETTA